MTLEVLWSELARDPKSVADKVDQGDVLVRRRDGAPLRLSREDRSAAGLEGLALAARLLRDLVRDPHTRTAVLAAVVDELSWTSFLPAADRAAFIAEFERTALGAAQVGTLVPLADLVREWQATAAIWAEPALTDELTRSLPGDGDLVPAPLD